MDLDAAGAGEHSKGAASSASLWRLRSSLRRLVPRPLQGRRQFREGVALPATFIGDREGVIRLVSVNDLSVGRKPQETRVCSAPCGPTSSGPATGRKGDEALKAGCSALPPGQGARLPLLFNEEISMSIDTLKARLPDYASDLRLNLGSLAAEPTLTEEQRASTFIVAALASRNPEVIDAMMAEIAPRLAPEALDAAKAAAAIMAMNNIHYRFTHLASTPDDRRLPAVVHAVAAILDGEPMTKTRAAAAREHRHHPPQKRRRPHA